MTFKQMLTVTMISKYDDVNDDFKIWWWKWWFQSMMIYK